MATASDWKRKRRDATSTFACPDAGRRVSHQIVRDHEDVIPAGIRLEQMNRDAAIRDLLLPVHQQLTQILTMANDTITVAGSDLMKASHIVYRALKSHGEEAGLRVVRDELARRFARSGRPEEEEEQETPKTLVAAPAGGEGTAGTPA